MYLLDLVKVLVVLGIIYVCICILIKVKELFREFFEFRSFRKKTPVIKEVQKDE